MTFARLLRAKRGTSVVEFALILPLFACMLYGILGYGQYFLLAHSVQQLANDAARATVAGMTATERQTLASASVAASLPSLPQLRANRITTTTTETGQVVTVSVRFDASTVPMFRNTMIPMPDPMIERRAVIRPGGVS
ncbi:TadE/TadG family type IV pilus assembly protein [Sphingomonas alpina]|uniref:Pilus assembly protein n=1 Tax=Sphingomonas alpina TaxID=653931 RepID=A0A7H0LED3_9SPHN|nr:TadE/TadG family type IV pilus assembly protein [Sphingomonas alpina]QNQ08036.1 pilus assembly protein [Sphingomonas alpina]